MPSALNVANRSASTSPSVSTRSRPTGIPPGPWQKAPSRPPRSYDLTATAIAVGTGSLLSPESHHAQVGPSLMGFGHPAPGCRTCHTLDKFFSYGLGVVLKGSWILQNPLFGGYSAVEAYLPSKKIAVAVAATFGEKSFDEKGGI